MAINKVGSKGIEDCSVAAVDFAPGTVTSVKLADDDFGFTTTISNFNDGKKYNTSTDTDE